MPADGPSRDLHRREILGMAIGSGLSSLVAEPSAWADAPIVIDRAEASVSPEAAAHPLLDYSLRARWLVEQSHLVNMLCNVAHRLLVRGEANSLEMAAERYLSWFKDPDSITQVELQRYYDSQIDTFYGAPDLGQLIPGATPFARATNLFEGWRRIYAAHPNSFLPIYSVTNLENSYKSGRIGHVLGTQNGDHFRTPDDIAHFYALGQRISQLTYNQENALAGGAFSDIGLKPAGKDVLLAMNAIGMAVDLAHSSDATARDVVEASRVTPIISHTNCRALNPGFPRDAPDNVIKAVSDRGGVIGLTVVRQFVSASEPTTIDGFIRHVDHVVELSGVEHVGIGTDTNLLPQDGIDDAARKKYFAQSGQKSYAWRERLDIDQLNHPRLMYDITDKLIARGYKDNEIALILGGNWVRVLKKIWSTRA